MPITLNITEFQRALQVVKPCTSCTDLPILSCVLIKTLSDRVSITAFDLSMGITIEVGAIVDNAPDALVIPYALLQQLTAKLTEDITFIVDGMSLKGQSGSTNIVLPLMEVEDYPEIFKTDLPVKSHSLDFSVIYPELKKASKICSKEILKGVLTGVSVKCVEDSILEFAATDGHRISVHQIEGKLDLDDALILPKSFIEAASCFKDSEVTLEYNKSWIELSTENIKLIGRQIDGRYPKYELLVPDSIGQKVKLDRQELMLSLDRIKAANDNKLVVFNFKKTILELECYRDGVAAKDVIPINGGLDLEIAFNLDYMKEALALGNDTVSLEVEAWNKPCLLSSFGYKHVLMPVQRRK